MDPLFAKPNLRVVIVGRNLDDLRPLLRQFPVQIVDEAPDLVISYGGDGSLLGAERDFPGVPKCPLRDARQNPKCPLHSEQQVLEALFSGQLRKTQLVKLRAELENGTVLDGINDIVIAHDLIFSAIRYRIWLNGELFKGQVVADSLVVATPFGSTGYFQSITRGNFQTGLGLAFCNALDLSGFTVVPAGTCLTVELLRGPAEIVADNNPAIHSLETGARITICAQEESTPAYGVDIFRCQDCFNLRRNGL